MERKYIFTEDEMVLHRRILHRIQAAKNFGNVKTGDIGGWIEREENLSHEGTCWIYDDAKAYDDSRILSQAKLRGNARILHNAIVEDKAVISGDAKIYGKAHIFGMAAIFERASVCGLAQIDNWAIIGGDAIVYEYAMVTGHAILEGRAEVYGSTKVEGSTKLRSTALIQSSKDYLTIGPIGSRNDYTTFAKSKSGDILVFCGCFTGTLEEFETRVREEHGENQYGFDYIALIEFIKKTHLIGGL